MKANVWFYSNQGFGSSTPSQIPVIDPNALCAHRRKLDAFCPECEREAERQAFINAPWKEGK